MTIGDVYRVTMVFNDNTTAKEQTSGFHIRQADAIMASINTVGDNVKDWWNTDLAGAGSKEKVFHPSTIGLARVELQRVFPLEPLVQSYSTGLPLQGTGTGDPLPPQAAVVVSLRTGNIGKRYSGRQYLPRVSEDHCDSAGGLSAGDALLIASQYEALRDSMASDDVPICVFSPEDLDYIKKNGDPAPRVGNLVNDVTFVEVDRRLRVIRKRALRTPVYVIGV